MQPQRIVDQRTVADPGCRHPQDAEAQEGRRDLVEVRGVREEWKHLARRVGQLLFGDEFVIRVGA